MLNFVMVYGYEILETDRKEVESTWTSDWNFTLELVGFFAIKKAHSEMSPKTKIRRINT